MENLGAMAYSRYTGFREITDRDVLELHCIVIPNIFVELYYNPSINAGSRAMTKVFL